MADKQWKQVERRVAKFFNSVRTPLSGFNSKHTGADVLHDCLFIEVKTRSKIPFLKTFKETIKNAKKEDKIPLVVFVEKGSQIPILMCKLSDVEDIGKIKQFPDALKNDPRGDGSCGR